MKETLKKKSFWLRLAMPLVIVCAWLLFSGIGGPYFGKISEVSSNDLATFLPTSAESTRVKDKLEAFQDSSALPLIVVFESDSKLTEEQQVKLGDYRAKLQTHKEVVKDISPTVLSEDGKAGFLLVPLNSGADLGEVIPEIRTGINKERLGINYALAGPAMFSRDLQQAFAGIDGLLLAVTLAVVFIILLVIYRSPILPIVTLAGAAGALAVAVLVVWHLADAGLVQMNGQVQGILFILVIGAATDYSLLYIARYREELTKHESAWQATKVAWKNSIEPIIAAGSTVSLGLLCLLASDLGSNRSLGPVGAIGVALAVLTAISFLPAALLLLGRAAFWPKRPAYQPKYKKKKQSLIWSRVAGLVGKHPRKLWVGVLTLLLVACLAVPTLQADGVAQSELVIGESEARDGQAMMDRHFPGGSGLPAYIVAPESKIKEVTKILDDDKGVESVAMLTNSESYPILPTGKAAEAFGGFLVAEPKVVDGDVILQATLKDVASSIAARDTIERLRDKTKSLGGVEFGGVSAIQLDTNNASERDLWVIIPLILGAITIVLMLLLRSIVAPLVLLVTTVISFGAAIGAAALLFNHVWQFPGGDPAVVIFGFVFLVALGIDYNIFLMTRAREETLKHGAREGMLRALVVTGGVITSAGIVLAATFAALFVIPILFLAQIAFIVAFGVLVDTLIVRSLLVPSLTLELGEKMWWPSKKIKAERN